ncbi:hypothetical protein BV25DRAFT_667259 [Artomyces pyxidatus]|uniref:Uncharacterized protein n=1 Tax=Artomyces pyxidatus TaxID=48021 RepID=A0ACB8T0E9_9AGAM|nr:hypothetical protein BV25DRAFT_667259 [Artomyces pyxidatus]
MCRFLANPEIPVLIRFGTGHPPPCTGTHACPSLRYDCRNGTMKSSLRRIVRCLMLSSASGFIQLPIFKVDATTSEPTHSTSISNMCHWRRVTNTFLRCGHNHDLPEEMIVCDSRWCKFSDRHPPDCLPPACTQTCLQFRQFPQMFNPQINGFCPACIASGRAG